MEVSDNDEITEPPKKRPKCPVRKVKKLNSLKSPKQMRRRTKPFFDSIVDFCEKEDTPSPMATMGTHLKCSERFLK